MTALNQNPNRIGLVRSTGAKVIAFMAVVAVLTACASGSKRAADPRYLTTGPNRIVVTESARALPVRFGDGERTLAPHALAPVQAFADDFIDQGGGTLYIEIADGGAEGDMAGKLSYLGAELRKRGVRPSELVVRPAEASRAAQVTLVYAKYDASVPGCPDWSSGAADFHRNVTHSNFGCASRGNMVKMLANPKDLAEPRKFGNSEGNQASRAISKYRSGEDEPVAATSSEVGEDE
jgi:pilus biogenesis lipoprotein CpaD